MYTISPPMLMISIGMQNADISPAVAGAAAPPGAQFALACNRLAGAALRGEGHRDRVLRALGVQAALEPRLRDTSGRGRTIDV